MRDRPRPSCVVSLGWAPPRANRFCQQQRALKQTADKTGDGRAAAGAILIIPPLSFR